MLRTDRQMGDEAHECDVTALLNKSKKYSGPKETNGGEWHFFSELRVRFFGLLRTIFCVHFLPRSRVEWD